MSKRDGTITIVVVLLVGLFAGAGLGYFMAPSERIIYTTPSQTEQTEISDLKEEIDGLTTLVYGAIGASLVGALAAIISLMQVTRRIGG